jgi:RHS repeat-associated protein
VTSRYVNGQSFTLNYDAENRLVSVTGASTANFYYDADGKQVKTVVNGVTTYYVGNHYEVKNSVVTKYYFAGATRLAVRTNGTLSYLLGDHPSTSLRTSIGSSSVTTDANGVKTAAALYKAFGETRFSAGNLGTDYKFTGQREEASLGIYYFNARWMDPSLGRFTSPDSIVPTSTQGTQAWDRYAYVNNNPVVYFDATGHDATSSTTTYTFTSATSFITAAQNTAGAIGFMRNIQSKLLLAGAGLIGLLGFAGTTLATGGQAELGVGAGAIVGGGAYAIGGEAILDQYDQDLQNLTDMQAFVNGAFADGATGITVTITETPIEGAGTFAAPKQTITICSDLGACTTYTSSVCPSNQHSIDRLLVPPEEDDALETENADAGTGGGV